MRTTHPYACHRCGAKSYRPVIARDASGALRATSAYRCTGCSLVFASPKAWREGETLVARPAAPVLAPLAGAAGFE